MARIVRIAATVVAVVAKVAAMIPGPHQPVAAAIAVVATAVAAAASVAEYLMRKPLDTGGQQTDFKADPEAGIPYVIGRTFTGGNIVHQDAFGKMNKYQAFVVVWSGAGPVQEIEAFKADRVTVPFRANGEAASGYYSDDRDNDTMMWLDTQLGATPESSALTSFKGALPGWTAASRLSGYAAGLWQLRYDIKGKRNYNNGVPKPGVIIKGVKVYDPRLDSTYPGGAGPCRAGVESTYVYSENPWLHALTWAIGRFANGKRLLGIGMPTAGIDVAAYVEAANIADANGWKAGGQIYSTEDKWDRLKAMAQAGGGVPTRMSAQLSCLVSAPRVSLATITAKDLVGEGSNTTTQPRRDRINGTIPRYRSEAHDWEMVPAKVVRVAEYVPLDGGDRTREVSYPLVQQVNQAAQLACYDVMNAREMGPITLTLSLKWFGYKPGDCVTVDIPELGLVNQPVIILTRSLDPLTGAVTMEMRSETPGKHAFALGQVGTPPPVPDTEVDPEEMEAVTANNSLTLAQLVGMINTSSPIPADGEVSILTATPTTIQVANHVRRYDDGTVPVLPAGAFDREGGGAVLREDGGAVTREIGSVLLTGLTPNTRYHLYYDDEERAGGAVTVAVTTDATVAQNKPETPWRHYVGSVPTPVEGSVTPVTTGGATPPGWTPGNYSKFPEYDLENA